MNTGKLNIYLKGNISRVIRILVCAALMCVWAGVASANVTYKFNATSSFVNTFGDQMINGSFQITVPTFISSNTTFTSDQLDSFGINTKLGSSLSSVRFYVNYFGQPYHMISIKVGSAFWNYYFDQGAFESVGKYNTVLWGTDQAGHLDVIETPGVPNAVSEILWRNTSTGYIALWYMDGSTITGIDMLPYVDPASGWSIVGRGDFNGDGKPDILWRNTSTGYIALWYMDGSTITGTDMLPYVDPASGWTIVGRGDFNGDGKSDILWRNTSTGYNAVWYMDGATVTGTDMLPYVDPASGRSIAGVGDFNGDGKPDIIWRNSSTGANVVWYMNGVTVTGSPFLPPEPDQTWTIAGVGDLNNDANPDILWRNIGPGPNAGQNRVWYMNGLTTPGVGVLPFLDTASGWKMEGN